jgi:enolase-phosphatase E1
MIKYILSDIEGTTTSISFVADVLFPYFLEHIDEVAEALNEPAVRAQIESAKATVLEEEGRQIDEQEAIGFLEHWCRTDRKHPALKALQGMVWEKGYKNGSLKGHVYPEVPEMLKAWKEKGFKIGIYSSGSVPAQKLLFGYSEAGDLRPIFSDYFDTVVGHKREVQSYKNIQLALGLPADEIVFLSDIEQELDAARAAGMQTIKLLRPGNDPQSTHRTAADFEEVNSEIAYLSVG